MSLEEFGLSVGLAVLGGIAGGVLGCGIAWSMDRIMTRFWSMDEALKAELRRFHQIRGLKLPRGLLK